MFDIKYGRYSFENEYKVSKKVAITQAGFTFHQYRDFPPDFGHFYLSYGFGIYGARVDLFNHYTDWKYEKPYPFAPALDPTTTKYLMGLSGSVEIGKIFFKNEDKTGLSYTLAGVMGIHYEPFGSFPALIKGLSLIRYDFIIEPSFSNGLAPALLSINVNTDIRYTFHNRTKAVGMGVFMSLMPPMLNRWAGFSPYFTNGKLHLSTQFAYGLFLNFISLTVQHNISLHKKRKKYFN